MVLLDTNVAIHLRDVESTVIARVAAMAEAPATALMTWVELENGIVTDPAKAADRRITTDALLRTLAVLPFDADVVHSYGRIVAARGFSRVRIIDRLIAATAIVHGLTLVTMNAADFRDIPGLTLEAWPAPGQ